MSCLALGNSLTGESRGISRGQRHNTLEITRWLTGDINSRNGIKKGPSQKIPISQVITTLMELVKKGPRYPPALHIEEGATTD